MKFPNRAKLKVEEVFAMAYKQNDQVEHARFGLGTVLSHGEDRIVIKFDDHGEKKFVSGMVLPSLKKSDREKPQEKRKSRAKKAAAPVAEAKAAE